MKFFEEELSSTGEKIHYKKHVQRGWGNVVTEVEMLQNLEKSFINEPEINHYPFPKYIDTTICTEHLDYNNGAHSTSNKKEEQGPCYIITMSHCGYDAYKNTKYNIKPINLYNTVKCIINNLYNVGIKHTSIKPQNTCINESGEVSLIDFDYFDYKKQSKLDIIYKERSIEELKEILFTNNGNTFKEELKIVRECKELPDFDRRFKKAGPWSILCMF